MLLGLKSHYTSIGEEDATLNSHVGGFLISFPNHELIHTLPFSAPQTFKHIHVGRFSKTRFMPVMPIRGIWSCAGTFRTSGEFSAFTVLSLLELENETEKPDVPVLNKIDETSVLKCSKPTGNPTQR